ncbi:MAG: hypothetical protein IT257_03640 [Chitinophagaceae bacterium]|nr:hypothetical protein [Chitinophagaceae bacterium]
MKTTFFLTLVFSFAKLFAADSLVFLKKIPVTAHLFTTDPVGNLYLVKGNNSLVKYNANGDSLAFFNEIKKGKITQIDASNPLRVLVYFADYGNILILDNILSLKSTLRLSALGIINAPCMANSADGNIWVYDPAGTLVKINTKPEISFTSSLRNVLDKAIDPVYMTEQDRFLYIVDSTEGVKKFDQFGLFKTSFPFITKEIQYFNSYLVYFSAPWLISYNTLSMNENKIRLPGEEDILKVRVERNLVYIQRRDCIDIYSLQEDNVD